MFVTLRCPIFTRVTHFFNQIFIRKNKNKAFDQSKESKNFLSTVTKKAQKENWMMIPRDQHHISRKDISDSALKVLYRLNKTGYEAYLVGGGVRDLLLGKKPKDFDVTTNATPDQLYQLFRNCRLVGRRFRLAHIMFATDTIEVATFRRPHEESEDQDIDVHSSRRAKNGMLLRDNIFGSIEEDAYRRDFTVNSLYYGIADFAVRDYTGGLKDLKQGLIRLIGDPELRYREDPVRMLRAIRFSAKLDMAISPETGNPILRLGFLLKEVHGARLFEESLKLFQSGYGYKTYLKLCEYQLFSFLFPLIDKNMTEKSDSFMERIIVQTLKNTDERLKSKLGINPAFLFSAMFWYPFIERAKSLKKENSRLTYIQTFFLAADDILDETRRSFIIPKRLTMLIKDIWLLQTHFSHLKKPQAFKLVAHPKFRLAYDLLVLRSAAEDNNRLKEIVQWWAEFQVGKLPQKNLSDTLKKTSYRRRSSRSKRSVKTDEKIRTE